MTMAAIRATLKDWVKNSTWRWRRMYQALIPPMMNRVVSRQATYMWEPPEDHVGVEDGLAVAREDEAAVLQSPPAGVCIQELATMIQKTESDDPTTTMQVAKKWSFGRHPVPAEDHDAQETGLEHEGRQGLRAQDLAEEGALCRERAPSCCRRKTPGEVP